MSNARETLKQQLLLNWNTFFEGFQVVGHRSRSVPGMAGVLQLPLKQNGKFSKLCEQIPEVYNVLLDKNIIAAGFNILSSNSEVFAAIDYPNDSIIMHLPLILPNDNKAIGMMFNDRVDTWKQGEILTHLPNETYTGFNKSDTDRVILHVVSR